MLTSIPALPLAGFLVNAAFGRRFSKAWSGGLACLAAFASFGVSLAAVRSMLARPEDGRAIQQTVFPWIGSGDFQAPFALRLDPLAAVMILVVTGVGFLIHVYSTSYMQAEEDSEYARYFSYLNLFTAFMLVLVLAANFVVMFVGWEGVGLCSYLLIGFWYAKRAAADAGRKAFIVNRVGDAAFILGMLLAFVRFGTLDFQQIARALAPLGPDSSFGTVSLIALLLFAGAAGKSAQIPLHVWLPDAMEGPTPVSALIHAATMVTAGVYLIGRNAVLFSHAPDVLFVVALTGTATAFLAGTVGLVQNDIKRVLAYSTISQLGYMFLAMGTGAFAAGIFHLYTHAFFKALLFLGAGTVIHALAGEQDLRRMGGLRRDLPLAYWTFLAGALALSGVPGLAGFFSKDEILFRTYTAGHVWLWAAATATSLLTAAYMFRLVFLVFHGPRATADDGETAGSGHRGAGAPDERLDRRRHGGAAAVAVPLVLLAVGSVTAGYVGVPDALGGANRIQRFLAPSFVAYATSSSEERTAGTAAISRLPPGEAQKATGGLEMALMVVATLVAFVGIGAAAFLFLLRREAASALARRYPGLHRLLLHKYYVDEIYDLAVVEPVAIISKNVLWRGVEVGLIDRTVNGVGTVVAGGGSVLRRLQTGSVRAYAVWLLAGVVAIVEYFAWR
jgi:NADH-quinone oxidoreductase subunit L